MAPAATRSRLADGRVVGWFGVDEVVLDAELAEARVPAALAARFGTEDFWGRWTATECAAKAHDVPIMMWIRQHGLRAGDLLVETFRWRDLVVSVAPVSRV